ncbi:uncharacterized protein LOC116288701 [Actinia tenebrosa]|uniref:Uncharacterized protein LOC116288701 n=1 Tax=Actinia tenebrosa TaxID=6105 RepID=A0A6P8H4V6_ACTTE|nr:uncharacterized protein LOC116288701 [Actinia tenebrosa]
MPRKNKFVDLNLLGTWQIICCESSDGTHENIKGVEFTLDEGDDVTWGPTQELQSKNDQESFPLLTCQTFEIVANKNEIHFYLPDTGHWIEFKVSFSGDQLVLTSGRNLKLNCNKILEERMLQAATKFSLLNALKEGYFSDLTLSASNGEKFAVHKTILSCLCPNEDWDTIPPFIQDLPPNVLRVILHYLYTGTLVEEQEEVTIRETLKAVESVTCLGPLVKMCEDYLKATAAIHKINTLVNDLEQAIDSITSIISSVHSPDMSTVQPQQLLAASKAVAQQVAIAIAKFVLLCDVFSQRKNELTRKERHKIIESIRNRLPGIVSKVHSLLLVCGEVLVKYLLTEARQQEVVTYLIPEIENFWKVISDTITDAQKTLDEIVEQEDDEQKKKRHSAFGNKLSRTFKNVIHLRELNILKKIQEEARSTFVFVLQKREDFSAMNPERKVTAVIKAIDFLTDEIDGVYLPSLEKFPNMFETDLKFKACKSLFKVGTARVSWLLERVQQNQSALQPSINHMCQLVNHESFNRAMKDLKLMESLPQGCASTQLCPPPVPKQKPRNCMKSDSTSSDSTIDSQLPTEVAKLLVSGKYADMTFIVGDSTSKDKTTNNKDTLEHLSCQACADTERKPGDDNLLKWKTCEVKENESLNETEENVVKFKAHRVILAARCTFFKCALLSGMKESIDRTILVPSTNPHLFHKFLESLYSGTINTNCMSIDQLVEMMMLTDMYEVDHMKEACEMSLCACISDDTVLYLLSMADRYNATQLKSKCLDFMTNPEIYMESEEFNKLSPELQQEVKQHLENLKIKEKLKSKELESSKRPNLEELTRRHLFEQYSQQGHHETKIEKCMQELTEILGVSIPRRDLLRITLAADCDVNRALNFYFSWQSSEI